MTGLCRRVILESKHLVAAEEQQASVFFSAPTKPIPFNAASGNQQVPPTSELTIDANMA
jgi:hypothetical protein